MLRSGLAVPGTSRRNCCPAGFEPGCFSADSLPVGPAGALATARTAVYSKRVRTRTRIFVDHRMAQVEALAGRLVYDPMTTAPAPRPLPKGS